MKRFIPLLALAALALVARLHAQSYTFTNAFSTYIPSGIVVDPVGNVYVTSTNYQTVTKFAPNGTSTILAGSTYSSGSADGTGTGARFNYPRGIALDSAGNLYVADGNNHTIRKISPVGVVSTLAGLAGNPGTNDGTGSAARFSAPQGLAVDSAGNVFVTDANSSTIRKITPTGAVTTFAGSAGLSGTADGSGAGARFSLPQGIAIDGAGTLYVTDRIGHTIRKISPAGVVTTLAGFPGNVGVADGVGSAAQFNSPMALAVDVAGSIFLCDTNNLIVRKVAPSGAVTTLGGLAGVGGDTTGIASAARFYSPQAIAVDAAGTLYIADSYYIKLGVPSSQIAFSVQPLSASVAAGATFSLTSTATGAAPISYQWSKSGAPIAGATTSTLTFPNVQAADAGAYLVVATNSVGTAVSSAATLTVLPSLTNNNFADSQILSGDTGSVAGRNTGATGEPGEPTHLTSAATSSSVWYRWTAAQSGTAVFNVSGFGTAGIGIYTGSTLASLTPVARGSGSRLTFTAVAGTTYSVAVGGYGTSDRGNFTLTWVTIPNDNFANAQIITGNSGTVSGRNDGATTENDEPVSPFRVGSSVWYRWTPTQSGTALFDVPNGFDAVVFTGNSLTSLVSVSPWVSTLLTTAGTTTLRRIFNVEAGVTYTIAVGTQSFSTGVFTASWQVTTSPVVIEGLNNRTVAPGSSVLLAVSFVSSTPPTFQWFRNGATIAGATSSTLTIANVQPADAGTYSVRIGNSSALTVQTNVGTLTVLVPPANDNFASAATVSGLTGSVTGSNVNATGEAAEPAHWNLSGTASSVWYRWTAPASGLASIDTVGSNFDTVLAIYTGPALASLSRLTQDDDRGGNRTSLVTFSAAAGTTYFIAVGGSTSGARGNLTLNWQLSATLAITTQPIAQTIAAGGSATLTVAASASNATFQWFRNGTAIPGATTATLTVSNIAAGADASYTVNVTSAGVTVTSAPATLAVSAPLLTTFSLRHTRSDGDLLWSIAAGNGQMVAVGSLGVILSSSDNGVTWLNRTSGTTGWLVAVTYGGGQFVIVGEGGTILTSPDGATWSSATGKATTERLNNIIYADGKYVAVGEKGTAVTSVDGNTWTLRSTPVTSWLHGLTYHAGIRHFAACGDAGVFLYSADAVTWNRLPVPGYTGALQHTVAVDSYSHFVAVGEQGKAISVRQNQLVLKDGESLTTWSAEANATNTTSHLIGLVQGAGALFATSDDGQVITAANDRGPWFSLPSGASGYLLAGLYVNNRLFIVGQKENIIQSEPIYATRLINISTRGQVGTGGNVMISGFIVTGTTAKKVLVRAAGPALAGFGLTGQLAAPVLTLFNSAGQPIAINSGWNNAANRTDIATTAAAVGAFPFAATSLDSAILTTLDPGNYTAQISGAGGTTGLAIVEAYDVDPLSVETSRAVNVSTRGLVGSGANKMIAGFVINGSASRRVLIRAVGPGLAAFGVPGTLAEPQLELYTSRGLLQTTAGAWGLQANADEIRGAAQVSGAFALADGSKDSAMVVTLLPGAWTVQVGGANGTSGVAIVEAYVLP